MYEINRAIATALEAVMGDEASDSEVEQFLQRLEDNGFAVVDIKPKKRVEPKAQ